MILYQSDDLALEIKQFNDGYRALSTNWLPHTLAILQAVVKSLLRKALGLFFMWSSPDDATGGFWLNKICTLGPGSCHASMLTVNLCRLTPAVVDAIATHAPNLPSPEPLSMLSFHEIRVPGAEGKHLDSAFLIRYVISNGPFLRTSDYQWRKRSFRERRVVEGS